MVLTYKYNAKATVLNKNQEFLDVAHRLLQNYKQTKLDKFYATFYDRFIMYLLSDSFIYAYIHNYFFNNVIS